MHDGCNTDVQAKAEKCEQQALACVAGTRSVGMMFRAVVFTFMPTAIELGLVCTLLARRFRPAVALLVLATFVAYVTWTTVMTQVEASPDLWTVF